MAKKHNAIELELLCPKIKNELQIKCKTKMNNKINEPFTMVPNRILNDPSLSLAEKGLIAIFLSNADDWKIILEEIYTRSSNREKSHKTVMKELKTKGYFTQVKKRNPVTRKFEWENKLHSFPVEPSMRTLPIQKGMKQGEPAQSEPVPGHPDNNTNSNNTNTTITKEEIRKKINPEPHSNNNNTQEGQESKKDDGKDKLGNWYSDEDELPF